MRVYYLSSAPFALSNLSLRRLKISRFGDLNDPFELLAANLEKKEHRTAFAAMKNQLNETRGLICFSQTWSNPLLWGHYAEKHTGVALGFDVPDYRLLQVSYTSQRVRIEVNSTTKRLKLDDVLVNRLLRTKFVDWMYEDEYRFIVPLDPTTKESGFFFQDFSDDLRLAEVILGPKCELPIDRVRSLLQTDLHHVKVLKARMAFRTFRVIEDRSFRRGASGAQPINPPDAAMKPR
jgi:hypothetical protein